MLRDVTRRGFLAAAAACSALSRLPRARAAALPAPAPTPRVEHAIYLRCSGTLDLKAVGEAIDTVNDREFRGAPPGSLVLVRVRTERTAGPLGLQPFALTYEFRATKEYYRDRNGPDLPRSDFSRLPIGANVTTEIRPVVAEPRIAQA